ncbi:MAG: clostripain-related cysteine peptidase [Elusimicrobiaceae bacterium]|nr:clostripain-related cysteine peptidase [Elusimicrobiaceae bacterium]
MKRFLIAAVAALCLAGLVSFSAYAAGQDAGVRKHARWTVMVYLNGNNNLAPDILRVVNEMEQTGSNSDVQMVVHMARSTKDLTPPAQYKQLKSGLIVPTNKIVTMDDVVGGSARYHVTKDSNSAVISFAMVTDADPASPATLLDFMRWGKSAYPADHYLLMMYGHGAGMLGTSAGDQNGGHSRMSIPDLGFVLRAAKGVDVLFFYSCLMQMAEVSARLDGAKLIIGSETSMLTNVPFTDMFEAVQQNAYQGAEGMAAGIFKAVAQNDTRLGRADPVFTLSVVRPSGLKNVIAALNEYVSAIISEHDLQSSLFARDKVLRMDSDTSSMYNDYCDLGHFIQLQASASGSEKVRSAAKALLTVIYKDYVVTAAQEDSARSRLTSGVSVYMPSKNHRIMDSYSSNPFGASKWGGFLRWVNLSRDGSGFDEAMRKRR